MWKNEKFTLTEKIFREVKSLVTSLVNTLLSHNFQQKSVRENFHTVHQDRPYVCVIITKAKAH